MSTVNEEATCYEKCKQDVLQSENVRINDIHRKYHTYKRYGDREIRHSEIGRNLGPEGCIRLRRLI